VPVTAGDVGVEGASGIDAAAQPQPARPAALCASSSAQQAVVLAKGDPPQQPDAPASAGAGLPASDEWVGEGVDMGTPGRG
jgi:hypothetical protein